MKVVKIPQIDLRLYHRNPRVGDVAAIAESLAAHGQYKPIVVNRGTHTGREFEVLAGNHTLLAARRLGWDSLQAVVVDVDDTTAAKIVLVDNRTSDLGSFDMQVLADVLSGIPTLDGTGYNDAQFERLLEDLDLADLPDELSIETDYGKGDKGRQLPRVAIGRYRMTLTEREYDELVDIIRRWDERHGGTAELGGFLVDGLTEGGADE